VPEQLKMTIKSLELGKERCLGRVRIQNPHRIMLVKGGYQYIAGILDGAEMAWGYETGSTDNCESLHVLFVLTRDEAGISHARQTSLP